MTPESTPAGEPMTERRLSEIEARAGSNPFYGEWVKEDIGALLAEVRQLQEESAFHDWEWEACAEKADAAIGRLRDENAALRDAVVSALAPLMQKRINLAIRPAENLLCSFLVKAMGGDEAVVPLLVEHHRRKQEGGTETDAPLS